MILEWLILHFLSIIGFLLALVLLAHILKERRSPTSTLAWLMAVIFIPYLGVPLYLMLGGRKMIRRAEGKPELTQSSRTAPGGLSVGNGHVLEQGIGISPAAAANRITLLPKGDQAFQTILALIGNARHSIHVATFILGNDDTGRAIVRALAEKAAQGLKVYLLLDALGSMRISKRFLSPLQESGGKIAHFMPMIHLPFRGRANLRNHRKMLICDHQIAVIGGMNLALEYMGPRDTKGRWRDLSLTVQGPVVEHISRIFRSDWSFASKSPLEAPSTGHTHKEPEAPDRLEGSGLTQLVASGPDVRNDSLRNAILVEIFRARRRIWIVTPYFVPDELMLEALCIAVRRGVDVSIVTPKKSNHRLADIVRKGYLTRIQEAGGALWFFEPRMLHAKAILVDDAIAIVGSANMDMRSLLLNYEIALCIYDPKVIGDLEAWVLDLKKNCSTPELQPKRSFGLVESVARLFAPLL